MKSPIFVRPHDCRESEYTGWQVRLMPYNLLDQNLVVVHPPVARAGRTLLVWVSGFPQRCILGERDRVRRSRLKSSQAPIRTVHIATGDYDSVVRYAAKSVHKRFGIHFGHSPHVDNNVWRWIEYLPWQMRQLAVQIAYPKRELGLMLTAVKNNDLVAEGV